MPQTQPNTADADTLWVQSKLEARRSKRTFRAAVASIQMRLLETLERHSLASYRSTGTINIRTLSLQHKMHTHTQHTHTIRMYPARFVTGPGVVALLHARHTRFANIDQHVGAATRECRRREQHTLTLITAWSARRCRCLCRCCRRHRRPNMP